MKKVLLAMTALLLCLLLCGCGGKDAPSQPAEIPTPPVTTELPTATAAPAGEVAAQPSTEPAEEATAQPSAESAAMADTTVAAGVYTYETADTVWTLTLRESGPYTLQKAGDIPHTGEVWVAEADGTVSCGPTDLWNESFADANGCSRWVLYLDGRCEPMILR